MPTDYEWITTEMFEDKLDELVGDIGRHILLAIPGVRALVREDLNNSVIEALEEERDAEPDPALHRCDAWDDCAYYASTQYTRRLSGSTVSVWWICTNCSKLAKLDGWVAVQTTTRPAC